MKKLLIATVAVISLTACATGPYQPTPSEEAIQSSRFQYSSTVRGIKAFAATTPVDCDSGLMLAANSQISKIETRASSFYSVLSGGGRYSNVQKLDASRTLDVLNPLAIKARFLMADAYLASGCLDQADNTYRSIQTRYSGSSFASVRERALLGVTDVKDRR